VGEGREITVGNGKVNSVMGRRDQISGKGGEKTGKKKNKL